MNSIIRNLIPRLKEFSLSLNEGSLIADRPWILIEHNRMEKLIFRSNGEVLILNKGSVKIGKWEYIPALKSLLIDRLYDKLLLKCVFLDPSVMIFDNNSGASDNLLIFINEDKIPDLNYEDYLVNYGSNKNVGGITTGQIYGGGIVFYVDNTGNHGLIVSKEAPINKVVSWAQKGKPIQKGSESRTDGYKNTLNIIKSQGENYEYAAKICQDYSGGGFKDWFLPANDQLMQLYVQRALINNINQFAKLWSSTGSSEYQLAYYLDFFNGKFSGELHQSYGGGAHMVRPIRLF